MSRPPYPVPQNLAEVDLTNRVLHATYDLADLWRRLRAEQPIHWHPATATGPGFWVLSGYRQVSAVYRDNRRFTSERGNVMDALRGGGDSAGRQMLSLTDGARHRDIRGVLTRTFSRRGLEMLGVRIRAAAHELIITALQSETCDFALDVAKEIPLQAICDLLGIPAAERQRIFALTSTMVASEHPDQSVAQAWQAKNEVLYYFSALADERRLEPGADIVSLLVEQSDAPLAMTDDEIVFNCYSLILGGGETTRMAISGGLLALIENPEQWAALAAGTVSVESAVEEVLRWTSPSMHLARIALEDVEVGDRLIRAGDIVTLWNVSANRDETAFVEPDRFDLDRSPNHHTALGLGSHFCLGSHLARLEISAVLESLRQLVGSAELVGPPRRIYSNFLGGLCGLPVTLRPRRALRPVRRLTAAPPS